MTLGERIVYYRKKAGLSQKSLAELIDINPTRLNYYEKDKREPNVQMINALCEALNVDGDTLLGREKHPPAEEVSSAEGLVTEEQVYKVFSDLGFIRPGRDLSAADVRFIKSIGDAISSWFDD